MKQRLFRHRGNCRNCGGPIHRGHVDNKFCSEECRKEFYNDINNATTALRKKLHPVFQLLYRDRAKALFDTLAANDRALRKVIHCHDFDLLLPVPLSLLQMWGFDLYTFTSVTFNPQSDGSIYWTYAMGVEVGTDRENVIIRFRNSKGELREMKRNP